MNMRFNALAAVTHGRIRVSIPGTKRGRLLRLQSFITDASLTHGYSLAWLCGTFKHSRYTGYQNEMHALSYTDA